MAVWQTRLLLGGGVVLLALLAAWGTPIWRLAARYRKARKTYPRPPFKPAPVRPQPRQWPEDALVVCWIGHSTVYIQWDGLRILTDPVLSERAGISLAGLTTIGVRRHTGPALSLEELTGQVDVIVLSHAHMDHVDLPTLRRLAQPGVHVVTAAGTGRLLRRLPFAAVHELTPPASLHLACGLRVQALPVRHWGARFPWNRGYGWNGYLLERRGVRLLFAGDTAYTPAFRTLRENPPVLACFPIGAYQPFRHNHCTPEEAWQMFRESGAKWLVPMHWDTFVLSQEPVSEPLERLLAAAGPEAHRVVIRRQGEVFILRPQQTGG
ncbi:MAG: MBL fold metallo-hydrolase [Alicyclobacillus sp.]|nr:MBL fold metallo-hydrolase [Alicyclobacillus sp.]